MQRVLDMMLAAILDTWAAVLPWMTDLAAAVPVWAWASLVTLVLVAVAVRMVRPTRVESGAAPDLLLTRVELTADGPSSARFEIELGFSNLHHEPVQLLRIAAVGASGRPTVRETRAIVAARHAVEIESDVELRPGGRGRLDLYALVPSSPSRAWRLRVPLSWDPFGRRYTGVLLDQSTRAVRRLPEPQAVARPGAPAMPYAAKAQAQAASASAAAEAPHVEVAPPTPVHPPDSDAPKAKGSDAPRFVDEAWTVPPAIAGFPRGEGASTPNGASTQNAAVATNGVPKRNEPRADVTDSHAAPDGQLEGDTSTDQTVRPARHPRLRFPDRF